MLAPRSPSSAVVRWWSIPELRQVRARVRPATLIVAAGKITLAVNVPRDPESQAILREGIRAAIDYAWFAAGHQQARAQSRDLKTTPLGVEKAAAALLTQLRKASEGAGIEIERNTFSTRLRTPDGSRFLEFADFEIVVDALRAGARAARARLSPLKQHRIHETTLLGNIARAIVRAGGQLPTLDKNSGSGTWLVVIDALRESLPPDTLNLSVATLASRTKKVRRSRLD